MLFSSEALLLLACLALAAAGTGWLRAMVQGHRLSDRAGDLEAERDRLREQLRILEAQATHDPLTGTWNRRRFEESAGVEMALARRRRAPVSLILLDLDHFKRVNDAFGHGAGDAVLVGAVENFRKVLRTADALTRWGGEEFIVLSPATGLGGALNLAERLRAELEAETFPVAGSITLSAGVAEYLEGESLEAWVGRADQALYRAKELGRNRVEGHPGRSTGRGQEAGGLLELAWDESYASGHRTVDAQHRALFELANSLLSGLLEGLPTPEVERRFQALLDHNVRHFRDEEECLRQAGYPDLPAHQAEHARLIQEARTLQNEVAAGRIAAGKLVSYVVCDLVRDHIIHEDRHHFPYLGRKPSGGSAP